MNKPFIENFNEKFMQVNIFVKGSIIDVWLGFNYAFEFNFRKIMF